MSDTSELSGVDGVNADAVELRPGGAPDLAQLSVLAMHVFVHTYCAEGLAPHLAREALEVCSVSEFARRMAAGHHFVLACQGDALLGFAETLRGGPEPARVPPGSLELVRLYVDPPRHRRGLGRRLLRQVEHDAALAGCAALWLTAWVGNARALAFYAAEGYADVGRTDYVFEGRAYENRVCVKPLVSPAAAAR
ncbi:MAG: GNAT family N-acetyltransferase [Rubrivivax sp.]|nr:GNAT family N-acetyltransferase [Rubrivivax sp.]